MKAKTHARSPKHKPRARTQPHGKVAPGKIEDARVREIGICRRMRRLP